MQDLSIFQPRIKHIYPEFKHIYETMKFLKFREFMKIPSTSQPLTPQMQISPISQPWMLMSRRGPRFGSGVNISTHFRTHISITRKTIRLLKSSCEVVGDMCSEVGGILSREPNLGPQRDINIHGWEIGDIWVWGVNDCEVGGIFINSMNFKIFIVANGLEICTVKWMEYWSGNRALDVCVTVKLGI